MCKKKQTDNNSSNVSEETKPEPTNPFKSNLDRESAKKVIAPETKMTETMGGVARGVKHPSF